MRKNRKLGKIKGRSMGIGKLGSVDVTFGRKFRWTLKAENLPEWYMKKVNFDFVNHIIDFEYHDVVDKNNSYAAFKWAEHPDKEMIFESYDGCGNLLSRIIFSGLTIVSHTSSFDYSISDISSQEIKVKYNSHRIETEWTHIEEQEENDDAPKHYARSSKKIEEIEINFANEKTWIPGRVSEG